MRFIIMSPEYTDWSGGIMVLHKLCHLLNQSGEKAYIHPLVKEYSLSWGNHITMLKEKIKLRRKKYKTNPLFDTPIIRKLILDDIENAIVVYPETISGNPLKAKHIVRWFLHHPGYQTGNVNYYTNELYFSYGAFGCDFNIYNSHTSNQKLHIFHVMNEVYNEVGAAKERQGTAYCLRKGKGREIVHDTTDSILIDGKRHKEIAEIFKRVKYFISYDLYTGYAWFAIMCGCIPIIIPEENKSITDWTPDPQMRLGIAYGFDGLDEAINTRDAALAMLAAKEDESIENVNKFIVESKAYFKIKT